MDSVGNLCVRVDRRIAFDGGDQGGDRLVAVEAELVLDAEEDELTLVGGLVAHETLDGWVTPAGREGGCHGRNGLARTEYKWEGEWPE